MFPIGVSPAASKSSRPWSRTPPRALATVMESLAGLVEVGVPIHRALDAASQAVDGGLREALVRVRDRVREGSTLASALAASGPFPPVTVGLVRAGERGLGLATGLRQAAQQLDRDAETRANIQAALVYPSLLLLVGSVSVGVIVLFVLPRFAALLGDVQGSLPPLTRGLLAVSGTVRGHGVVLTAGVAAVTGLAIHLLGRHRALWNARLLDLPVIGPLRHGLASARVTRALGALLGTGMSAVPALAVAREAAGDTEVARRLEEAGLRVTEGASLGDALVATRALTPGASELVRIAERSGRLPDLLERSAVLEERAAARRVRSLVATLEPALIIAFAAVVALVAGALLQAIYSVRPGSL